MSSSSALSNQGEGELVRVENELRLSLQRAEIDSKERVKNEEIWSRLESEHAELRAKYENEQHGWLTRDCEQKIELGKVKAQYEQIIQECNTLKKGNGSIYSFLLNNTN